MDNYLLQAQSAMRQFLRYDQSELIRKLGLRADEDYLYTRLLSRPYRIHRSSGQIQRLEESWVDAGSHAEVMTLLDLVCDSREDRFPAGRWQNLTSFGVLSHRSLLENQADSFAAAVQADQPGFRRACEALGGRPGPGGDISYDIPFFDTVHIAIQFWEGDEEFPPRVRLLWDENALMYLKYETTWFAMGLIKARILEHM